MYYVQYNYIANYGDPRTYTELHIFNTIKEADKFISSKHSPFYGRSAYYIDKDQAMPFIYMSAEQMTGLSLNELKKKYTTQEMLDLARLWCIMEYGRE